jgi:hypothetical protein
MFKSKIIQKKALPLIALFKACESKRQSYYTIYIINYIINTIFGK